MGFAWQDHFIKGGETVGGMWLNALRMTIVPLVVALLITGIAASAAAARASRLSSRALVLYVALLWVSAIAAAVLTPLLLGLFPRPAESAAALREALSTAAPVGDAPSFWDFIASIVPSNVVSAAAEEAILPLILFTFMFGFAVTRLSEEPRERIVGFF